MSIRSVLRWRFPLVTTSSSVYFIGWWCLCLIGGHVMVWVTVKCIVVRHLHVSVHFLFVVGRYNSLGCCISIGLCKRHVWARVSRGLLSPFAISSFFLNPPWRRVWYVRRSAEVRYYRVCTQVPFFHSLWHVKYN